MFLTRSLIRKLSPSMHSGAEVSDCGKWLIITSQKDCRDNLLFFCNLSELPDGKITGKLPLTQIVHKFEADYEVKSIVLK